ncbi:isoleucine--tRNA ligase [bacterium]|nr:isoleucine--tRNA ligase [bacterium]|tara:strand:+ start:39692 stop:42508 length:2817 start_codon:yes stop_codon:yes gene_type:complete
MYDFPKLEKKILKSWQKNKIFEKSIKARKGQKSFIFYEGPPTANGKPGIHHVLARAFKDLFPRYKTMQGFYCERKAGWDTHGLPVELEVEKKLGISGKHKIESLKKTKFASIKYFNKLCQKSVWKYKKDWEDLTRRIGFWIDLENPYITYKNEYIKNNWKILKKLWDKKLLVQDYKIMPYCPRCGTSLSSHEVAQGYKKVKEESVYVKFQLCCFATEAKNKLQTNSKFKIPKNANIYLLAWTTTPWTLPGNVALAVGKDIDYILAKNKKNNEYYILAKTRKDILKSPDYKLSIINYQLKGKDLIGLEYKPLFDIPELQNDKSHKVYNADFVNTQDGTGIVHTAVMYGADDYELGQKVGLPKIHTVDEQGKFNSLVKKFQGIFVKKAEKQIIADMEKRNLLFKNEKYEHEYPFCWRCDTHLLYYAKKSWFIKMSLLRNKLRNTNEKINWVPAHLQKGRFGEWLREAKDWALSRERYWGTPLPIWQCTKCNKQELRFNSKGLKILKDLHRPYIDKITFPCKCDGIMKRVPEVLDCWFDSGAMPFSSQVQDYPADFISEAIDQTRGWFYTLLAISTALEKGTCYKNVISLGHILDKHGKKMSKSKGNVVVPKDVIETYGVDALRWYLYSNNQPGEPKKFDIKDVQENMRKIIATLWNSFVFYRDYAQNKRSKKNILDTWIISRLNQVILETTQYLDKYDVFHAARGIEEFIDDLSNWYIRRTRKDSRKKLLGKILVKLCKIMTPFVPFITDCIYREIVGTHHGAFKSVHLSDWPKPNKKLINKKLNKDMQKVREICTLGLSARSQAQIKVRQPLQELQINKELNKKLLNIIAQELNIKTITAGTIHVCLPRQRSLPTSQYITEKSGSLSIALDTKITPELKREGEERELIREIQNLRKKENLLPKDKIRLVLPDLKLGTKSLKQAVLAHEIKKGKLKIDKI